VRCAAKLKEVDSVRGKGATKLDESNFSSDYEEEIGIGLTFSLYQIDFGQLRAGLFTFAPTFTLLFT
jgi:hypothetical protein